MSILVFNILMFVCCYIALPIIYFMMRNEAKAKKNIVIGVTLPYSARTSAEVQSICNKFRKNLDIMFIIMTLICIGAIFIPSFSISFTYYMTWLVFAVIIPGFIYISSNKKLRKLKVENNWYSSFSEKTIVDLKTVDMPKRLISSWWFVPPVLICLIPVAATLFIKGNSEEFWYMFATYLVFALIVASCYLFFRIIYRQRAEIVDENTELSIILTRVRQYNWSKCWVWTAWLTSIYTIFFWLLIKNVIGLIISTAAYTILVVFVCIKTELTTRRIQQKFTEKSGTVDFVDDDRYWLYGLFYYNENDNRLMINNRVGMGMSVNLARLWGKIIMGFAALCILVLPVLGIWLMAEEFTPIRMEMTETQIIVHHLKKEYVIDINEIDSFELIDKLPPISKIVGTGMDHLCKGRFSVDRYGICNICLNPKNSKFLVIFSGDSTHIFSTTDEEVMVIYEKLARKLR
ncbi:MAG TPA: hypothetical protein GXX14_09265 [Clostridiaceae bacterium]|nr:hypothetical protein [Clostridiaceae bacterium]